MLWTASLAPFGSPDTLSHTSMMAPQSSDVRFSSVALATAGVSKRTKESEDNKEEEKHDSASFAMFLPRVRGILTDDFVERPSRRCSEHGGGYEDRDMTKAEGGTSAEAKAVARDLGCRRMEIAAPSGKKQLLLVDIK